MITLLSSNFLHYDRAPVRKVIRFNNGFNYTIRGELKNYDSALFLFLKS